MSNNSTIPESVEFPNDAPDDALVLDERGIPVLTIVMIAICSIIYFIVAQKSSMDLSSMLQYWVLMRIGPVSAGGLWGLITSIFVHVTFWHFGLNMYWLWKLGHLLEDGLGWWRFFIFCLLAAIISSGAQFLVSGTTGIGMSGVIYAMFGFMWVSRFRFVDFQQVVDPRTAALFLIWMTLSVVVTATNVLNIGNGAHIVGCLFGAAVARLYGLQGEAAVDDSASGDAGMEGGISPVQGE